MLQDRRLVLLFAVSLLGSLLYVQSFSTFPLQVRASGFGPSAYGLLLSLNGLLVIVCELPLTAYVRRYPGSVVLAMGLALQAAGFGLLGEWSGSAGLVASVLARTAGEMLTYPTLSARLADLAPPELQGRYQGAWGLAWGLASIAGPSLGSLAFGRSPKLLWTGCLVVGVSAAAVILLGERDRRPR